jgi:glycosyltransferase involved in cell wall biosynthesis
VRVSFLTSARTWRGSCVSLANIAGGLMARGHQAELLTGEDEIARIARGRGIPAVTLPMKNTGWRELRALRKALRSHRSEALVTDRPRDLRLGAMASVGKRLALIYRYNVSRPRPPSDLVTRLAYYRVSATVFRAQAGADQVLAEAPFMAKRPHRIITGGVDTSIFYPDPHGAERFRKHHRLGDGPMILAVGALMPEKRYPEMFEVMRRLGRPVPLLICGAGKLEEELKGQASQLAFDVRFLGLLPQPELRGAYAAATVSIHTCQVETFGLSVAEAMSCGRPVVVAQGGAMDEVVGDAGIVVPGDDLGEFAGRLGALLDDPVQRARLGAAAHTRSVARFSVDSMVAEYERLLREVVR